MGVLQDATRQHDFLRAIIYEVNKSLLSHFSTCAEQNASSLSRFATWPASLCRCRRISAPIKFPICLLPAAALEKPLRQQFFAINNHISRPMHKWDHGCKWDAPRVNNLSLIIYIRARASRDLTKGGAGEQNWNEKKGKEINSHSTPDANKPPLSLTSGICPFLS